MQNFISRELTRQGYSQVFTPHIGKLGLYRTSGHFPYYKESQYPPIVERETLDLLAKEGCTCAELSNKLDAGEINGYLLKPMNCPHHIKIFASQKHSYRDLPIRLAEFGTVYRWEQSGELGGMTRVRSFTQDDAHLFCTEEQLPAEVLGCLESRQDRLQSARHEGLPRARRPARSRQRQVHRRSGQSGTRPRKPAAMPPPASACRSRRNRAKPPSTDPRSISWSRTSWAANGSSAPCRSTTTCPIRFDLDYTGSDGKEHRPVMIHRAPFGSMERFIGCLIEHFAGPFPVWLAPEQVRLLTVTEAQNDYAQRLLKELKEKDVRVTLDDSREKLGAKIRLAELAKVPYILTLGERESTSEQVSVRSRKLTAPVAKPWPEFFHQLLDEIAHRSL